ncbi:hypothetical protein, partial [Phenylobacterium sp.]|uniref:hypothetical protein n=1 Tax=Phenylobacterium sp. TaxID=1871053 RepID=UPI00273061EA
IQHAVIEGLEPDADVLTIHIALNFPYRRRSARVTLTISKTNSGASKAKGAVRVARKNEFGPRVTARATPWNLSRSHRSQVVLRTASATEAAQPVQQEAR